MKRPMRWYDHITINIYWLGLTSLSQTMTPLVIPLLIQQFVGEQLKGSYYGNLRLWTLMAAILVQALMGMLSDRSTSKWGRRRPFIFTGTIGVILVIISIGLSSNLEGLEGYWVLFGLVLLQMFFSNIAHGAQQGLIPDLVSEEKRGLFSGIKAIFEVPLPVILIAFTVAKFIANGNLWMGLIILIAILFIVMLATMFVPEKPLTTNPPPINWQPYINLLLMTGVFTLVILGMGLLTRLSALYLKQLPAISMIISLGIIGLLSMLIAIAFGVKLSTKIGLGKEASQNSSFVWWVINRLTFLVGSTNLVSFVIYFIQGRFDIAAEAAAKPAATLTQFVGIFILVSALPSGWLADRFGYKLMVMISGFLAALGTLVVIIAPTLPVFYVGGMIIGAAIGQFYSTNWALGTEIVPPDQAGRYLGMSNLAGAGAGAIGAYIGGPIADTISNMSPEYTGAGYILLFGIYGMLFLISIFALKGIKQKL